MTSADRWLMALWLLIATLIGGLSYLNPTHYLSPDSLYYLSMAGRLVGLDGDQYGHVSTGWELDFPVGYPLLIGGVARLTGTSLLVASKLVNIGLVAVFLLLWRRRLGARAACWMGSVLLLGGHLRLLAYTWSEWAFLVLLLEWYWQSRKIDFGTTPPQRGFGPAIGYLIVLTVSLFWLRYVGAWVIVVYALRAGYRYWRGGRAEWQQHRRIDLLYMAVTSGVVLGTFWVNSLLTPWPLGTERFYANGETWLDKFNVLALAPINELLLIRDYIPGEPVGLVLLGILLQVALMWWVWQHLKPRLHTLPDLLSTDGQLMMIWFWATATYLAVVFGMRLVSPFAGPNARMMAVASLPFLMGIAAWISRWSNATARRKLALWWGVALFCSWLQLLPQANLWEKLMRFLA